MSKRDRQPGSRRPPVGWLLLLLAAGACAWGFWALTPAPPPALERIEVVNTYPHDPEAFTQGLVFADGLLYEGTGLVGHSALRQVELPTGRVLEQVALDPNLFGEGIAVLGDEVFQLTWQDRVAIVYDRPTLREKRRCRYEGEGWGLTHDGRRLIRSDGTPTLHFHDPATFAETGSVCVTGLGGRTQLNELEYVRGEVYANIWYSDHIVRIDPGSGRVVGWIDCTGLGERAGRASREDVLNGIAFDEAGGRLFLTGKNWPQLFEVRVLPR